MNNSLSCFNDHINGIEFQVNEASGRWGIASDMQFPEWPSLILWLNSKEEKSEETKLFLKFDLTGYPTTAPTSVPWDIHTNQRLSFEKWPKGSPSINVAFNAGWNSGNALYIPCDRIAMTGHEPWQQLFPEYWWKSSFTINVYLQCVYEILRTNG